MDWIPLNEALPPLNKTFLVIVQWGNPTQRTWEKGYHSDHDTGTVYVWGSDPMSYVAITHWCLVPEMPKLEDGL